MASNAKEFKGQLVTIEGSRSGADIFTSKRAYDSAFNLEYNAEAKHGTPTNVQRWYIEKFLYDTAFNNIGKVTAINKIYIQPTSVQVTAQPNNLTEVSFIGGNLTQLNIGDAIALKTTLNTIEGVITLFDKTTSTITVNTLGNPIINEGPVSISATGCILTLNHEDTKPYNRRVWDLRTLYIYE